MGVDCSLFLLKSKEEFISIDLDRLYMFSFAGIPIEQLIYSKDLKDVIIDRMDNFCEWYDNGCAPLWRHMYWMSIALNFVFKNGGYEDAIIVSEHSIEYGGFDMTYRQKSIEVGSGPWEQVCKKYDK